MKISLAKEPSRVAFKPDLNFKKKAQIEIPAGSETPWHYEEIPHDRTKDLWIASLLPKFQNRKSLQHVALLVMRKPMDLSQNLFQPEYRSRNEILNIIRFLPNTLRPLRFGDRLAFRIPKDSTLYLALQFASTGKNEKHFVEIEIEEYQGKQKTRELFYAPLDAESHKLSARRKLSKDIPSFA